MHGSLEEVVAWLDDRSDSRSVDARCPASMQMTLLMGAALGGQKPVVVQLLDRKANIDVGYEMRTSQSNPSLLGSDYASVGAEDDT